MTRTKIEKPIAVPKPYKLFLDGLMEIIKAKDNLIDLQNKIIKDLLNEKRNGRKSPFE